jgi:hypothetical protein
MNQTLLNGAGGDGEAHPPGPVGIPPADEADELLRAWLRERGRYIESKLILDRVGRLLRRISADGRLRPRDRGELRRLIRAIALVEKEGVTVDG